MAALCGFDGLDSLIDATVPKSIRLESMKFTKFDEGLTESQMLEHMKNLASKNQIFKSFIGMGYYNTHVPPVILRNIMEIQLGTLSTHLTRLRFPRGGWSLCSITKL